MQGKWLGIDYPKVKIIGFIPIITIGSPDKIISIFYSLILIGSNVIILSGGGFKLIWVFDLLSWAARWLNFSFIMNLRTLIFYGILAVIPAYFFNRWLMAKILPRQSFLRFLLFLVSILAFALSYTAWVAYLLSRFVWPSHWIGRIPRLSWEKKFFFCKSLFLHLMGCIFWQFTSYFYPSFCLYGN